MFKFFFEEQIFLAKGFFKKIVYNTMVMIVLQIEHFY